VNRDAYFAYLHSPWWRARKAAVLVHRGARCERCASTSRLELHHRTYERLFREQPEDVVLLCRVCHQREHGIDPKSDVEPWADVMVSVDADALLALLQARQQTP
jgi:hypothetical protein